MRLADIERGIRETRAFEVFERTHLHRAMREDDWGPIRGRETLRDAALAALAVEGHGPLTILHDLGDMIAFETHRGWRGHRWVRREGERIIAETAIDDGVARARALGIDPVADAHRRAARSPVHPPLGELRAGQGQLGTADRAVLPGDFPSRARAAADAMHRAWNGRALASIGAREWTGPDGAGGDATAYADWLAALFVTLPDAVLLFERALVVEDRIALLWRLHGHDAATGRRVRAIGSSVLTMAGDSVVAEDVLVDTLALAAAAHRPLIDLGS